MNPTNLQSLRSVQAHARPSITGTTTCHVAQGAMRLAPTTGFGWTTLFPGGGAAAVGGDWGLRMPVASFLNAMGRDNLVIEHEIGHDFGF